MLYDLVFFHGKKDSLSVYLFILFIWLVWVGFGMGLGIRGFRRIVGWGIVGLGIPESGQEQGRGKARRLGGEKGKERRSWSSVRGESLRRVCNR